MALFSALWTTFCAALLVGWQITRWLREGVWHSDTVAAIIKGDPQVTYSTASYTEAGILEKVLEIPAIVPLMLAVILLLAFRSWVAGIETESSPNQAPG
jgi:hypothetical protein